MDYPTKNSIWQTSQADRRGPAADRVLSGRRRGFSLAELLIAMTISILVMGGVLSSFLAIGRGMQVAMAHSEQSSKLNYAVARVSRTLRPLSDVHQATDQVFEFSTSDMKGNSERVRLYYDADTKELIERSLNDGTDLVILEGVESLKFRYFDRHGDATGTLIDMNAVQLELETLRTETTGSKSVKTETAIYTFRNKLL